MNDLIIELLKFSDDIVELGDSIEDDRIKVFEEKWLLSLPNDYKDFVRRVNGFSLMGTEVYEFDSQKANSIENVYYREHFQVNYPQFPHLVPFSPDGRGNFYCIDTKSISDIVFWTSNYEYSEEDYPEVTHSSFTNWVQEVVINWTLEDYNYDGSEK